MHFTTAEIANWLGNFMWPFMRISAFVAAMPILTTRGVPMQLRLIFAVALTVVIAPLIPAIPNIEPISGVGILTVINQLVIGVAMAFTLRLVFSALVSAGQITALGMGLGFASMVDPTNGVQVPVVSMFYMVMGTLLFLALDGHLVTIEVLAESFHILPISSSGMPLDGYWDLLMWASWMFAGAVLISLPVITSILVVNIAFGVMTRAAPQLNIFAVGFPIIMTVGFALMLITLPHMLPQFTNLTDGALQLMRSMISKG